MRTLFGIALMVSTLLTQSGCGDPNKVGANEVQVTGLITLNDQPLANALVTFIPEGNTLGNGGSGTTDATGKYKLVSPHGKQGMVAGTYKVTVSHRLNPDGSLPDPNIPPIQSSATERLPINYTDPMKTELSTTIAVGDKKSFDFPLKVMFKK